ncbi:MAG: hypothetical protein ACREKI_00560, partial [Gemmatimonadota bacterium]
MRDRWIEYGLEDVEIVEHEVLLSYGERVSVEMVEPVRWQASLKEDPYPVDPDTYNPDVGVPYHAYSASGDTTAEVVYAHSGNPEDYDRLLEMGIDIRGKVALVRYSVPYSYRGFKVWTAQRRGAAARRRGHPHLLRSGGRRVREGRRLSRGPVGPGEPHPARRRRVRLPRAGRSVDPGLAVDPRRAAPA